MKTYHSTQTVKGHPNRAIKLATVTRLPTPAATEENPEPKRPHAVTVYKEGFRVRLPSREARRVIRSGGTLTPA